MSAVLQESRNEPDVFVIHLLALVFDPIYAGHSSMVLMHPSNEPRVGDRLEIVEVFYEERIFIDRRGTNVERATGREVCGTVTNVFRQNAFNTLVHFKHTGRTWNMRDEHNVHGESFVVKPENPVNP